MPVAALPWDVIRSRRSRTSGSVVKRKGRWTTTAYDKFIVDDIPLARYFDELGRDRVTEDGRPDPEFPGGMPEIYSTIGDILSGKKPGRESEEERIVAIPIGMAICDIALTHLIYETAVERNVGRRLNLM